MREAARGHYAYSWQSLCEHSCLIPSVILIHKLLYSFFKTPHCLSTNVLKLFHSLITLQWYLLIWTLPNPNTFGEQILTSNPNAASQFEHKHTWRPVLPTQQLAGLASISPPWIPLSIATREQLSSHFGPQAWSLPTYHPSQFGFFTLVTANVFTNEDIFNTLNNHWRMNC